jgi:hypothetical protein
MSIFKQRAAKYANVFFVSFAMMMATTGCIVFWHNPEIPQDLVRK